MVLLRRRPTASMLVALLALFIALGGPAQAQRLINGKLLKKGTVTTRAIKDRTIASRDLSRKTVRELTRVPGNSVTEAQIANGAITQGKLATGAVTSRAIGSRAVSGGDVALSTLTGANVADGGMAANDIGKFWGRFTVSLPAVQPGECWSGEPVGLAPERAKANIKSDVILVTPGETWPDKKLSLTVRQSALPSRFVLIACNPTNAGASAATQVLFNYVVIAVP
jgi:hypothetical protein